MERLSRLIPRHRAAPAPPAAQAPAEPHLSVLDVGSGSVKALVVSTEGEQPAVLSYASETLPAQVDEALLLRAAERALVRAEDTAGAVPRSVAVGVGTAACVVARSEKDARLRVAAERGTPEALSRLHEGVYAVVPEVERLRRLVTVLDLDLIGLIATPLALAAAVGDGLVVDVGGAHSGVVVARDGACDAALALPIGGAALEERLRDRLGVGESEARQAVAAHAAGAGHRSGAGLAAARTIDELARHHADVWLDALETGLGDLGRGRSLPGAVWLCGGGSTLPELREALDERAWHVALPFEAEPRVELAMPSDVSGVDLPPDLAARAEALPAVCLALAAVHLHMHP